MLPARRSIGADSRLTSEDRPKERSRSGTTIVIRPAYVVMKEASAKCVEPAYHRSLCWDSGDPCYPRLKKIAHRNDENKKTWAILALLCS